MTVSTSVSVSTIRRVNNSNGVLYAPLCFFDRDFNRNMDSYITVKKEASEEYIVKKSRFIGYIKPVSSKQEALDFINAISKKHWDATHNVYAYILRDEGIKKFSDDGEPQGTAGMPVLDVIEKNSLTDVCIVVTRYFGGILLGAGGLVRAYSHSASVAIEASGKVTRALCARLRIICDYTFYGKLASLIPENGGIIEDTLYEDSVTVIFRLPVDECDRFASKLTDASNGRYAFEETERLYADIV